MQTVLEMTERQLAELRRIVAEHSTEPALRKLTAEPGLRVIYVRSADIPEPCEI